jgi:hypothetical protein
MKTLTDSAYFTEEASAFMKEFPKAIISHKKGFESRWYGKYSRIY